MKPVDRCTLEQAQLLEEFRRRAKRLHYEFFAVLGNPKDGSGGSVFGTTSESPTDSAARHARRAHIEWELQHGIDPYHNRKI